MCRCNTSQNNSKCQLASVCQPSEFHMVYHFKLNIINIHIYVFSKIRKFALVIVGLLIPLLEILRMKLFCKKE